MKPSKRLEKLETNKATGLDNLPSKMFNRGRFSGTIPSLLVQWISSGIVPTEWKLTRRAPILTKGERQDVTNYQPICFFFLLPSKCLGKNIYISVKINFSSRYLNKPSLDNFKSGFRSLNGELTSLLREASNSRSVNTDNGLKTVWCNILRLKKRLSIPLIVTKAS